MKNDQPMAAGAGSERKPYVRPSVSEVPLRLEEAVLGFCKTESSGGPLQGACNLPTVCSAAGS